MAQVLYSRNHDTDSSALYISNQDTNQGEILLLVFGHEQMINLLFLECLKQSVIVESIITYFLKSPKYNYL